MFNSLQHLRFNWKVKRQKKVVYYEQGQKKEKQCFVFTADGKESSVLLMKNVADRMSQRNIFPRDHSLHQRLNRTALCTRLSAMAEVGRLRKGKTQKNHYHFFRHETSVHNPTNDYCLLSAYQLEIGN